MNNIKTKKALENYISNLSDSDFISFCDRLLIKLNPTTLLSSSILDNGFNNIDGNYFIPVPNEFETSSSVESLIPDDIDHDSVKSIIFLSNNSFFLTPEQKEIIRSKLGKIRIDVWGLETIKLRLSSFSEDELFFIIGDDSVFSQYFSDVPDLYEDLDIINNIFNFIKANAQPIKKLPNLESKKYSGITKKVNLNFTTFRERVLDLYQLSYYHKSIVEKYFQDSTIHDKSEVIILREFFRSKYISITGYLKSTYPVNEYKYLEMLVDACLDEQFKKKQKYQLWAKAIVMYFFEYCDFGARTKEDTIIQGKLFDNLNSDLT